MIEPANAPGSPQPRRNTALAGVLALLLAAGLIPLLDRLDRRLREPEELEQLLGMVPGNAFPGRVSTPLVRESFQTLRASLTYFNVDRSLSSVLVTSGGHSEEERPAG